MKNTGNLLLKTRKKPGISSQSKSSKTVTEISAEALQSEENKRENMLENQGKERNVKNSTHKLEEYFYTFH